MLKITGDQTPVIQAGASLETIMASAPVPVPPQPVAEDEEKS